MPLKRQPAHFHKYNRGLQNIYFLKLIFTIEEFHADLRRSA
jgi:hypothetical protein